MKLSKLRTVIKKLVNVQRLYMMMAIIANELQKIFLQLYFPQIARISAESKNLNPRISAP